MTPTEDMIDMLVDAHYSGADARTKHQFRTELAVLVELAKCEERQEINLEPVSIGRQSGRVVH